MAYQTLGVVYGDLGTSPLYVFSSLQYPLSTIEDYFGVLSLILWSLTMIPLVKYVFIVLRADDHGEGMEVYVLDTLFYVWVIFMYIEIINLRWYLCSLFTAIPEFKPKEI